MTSKHASTARFFNNGLFDNLITFADLEARLSALPTNKERGDAFEIFAEAYLATQKIALAQEVWPFEAIPLEQRRTLSLDTGRDMGVDGTYLTTDGELRAYQVKFRSNRPSLTWDELSTFMGLTDQVSQRVLFTNCEALPSLMQDRSGFVAIRGSDLDRLAAEDFDAMRQWLRSGQVQLSRKSPKPHQQEALDAISQGIQESDRATVVMACGTGKSLVALWAAERLDCKTLLVLVPSLALVRQLLHEWLRETAWDRFTFMCVCSDPTVAKGADDLIVHQADLDFPVTTDSAVVRRFLGKPFDGVKIVFSTYQSAQVVAEGLPLGADGIAQPFDLGIFDEAHKTASRDGTRFSFALEDRNLPIHKRLFFTATPRHYDVRKKDKEGDNTLVYSMDRPEVYGPVVHTLSFAEAARRDIICDYKVVISVVTSAMVDDHALRHGETIVAGDTVKARQVALQIALQKAVEKYGVSRIFTFHGSVKAARSFTSDDGEGIRQHLPEFTTLHVSGEMPTARREDQMKSFRQAQKAVMSNARCLTEGVDVPAVDMVAFITPRKSKVDIVQATGRAMRRSPDKEFGYVMVPLFVEQAADESIEEALHRTGFDDVWDLLGAMREQDDVLVDIIRQMQEDKGRTGGYDESRFSERVEVLGPSVSLETIRESITAECLDSLGVSWDEWFGRLVEYVSQEGHCRVSKDYQAKGGYRLGLWISNQRANEDTMSRDRKLRLESLSGWVWDSLAEQWEIGFRYLTEFVASEGHCLLAGNYKTNDGYRLGQWVAAQRKRREVLLQERKNRLEAVPGWVWDVREAEWDTRFNGLKAYKSEHGNVDVPIKLESGLGMWVSVQRRSEKNGKLSPEKKARLNEIGFIWDTLDAQWVDRLTELVTYKEKHGDFHVPQNHPSGLGYWISQQKVYASKGKLPEERKAMLEQVGFSWENRKPKSDWDERFNELTCYKEKHGSLEVPRSYPGGLGNWVGNQKSFLKKNQISNERRQKLIGLGLEYESLEAQWEARFIELIEYKKKYGDLMVPIGWATGLGPWVKNQRAFAKSGRMADERRDQLDAIGFGW